EKSVSLRKSLTSAGVSEKIAGKILNSPNLLKITDSIVYLANDVRERIISELEKALGENFENYPSEYRLLDWEKVREMSRKGISFGVHTANHVILPLEQNSMMEAELVASKNTLEKEIGVKVNTFAYPNGEFDNEIKQLVGATGYKIAVTTRPHINRTGAD